MKETSIRKEAGKSDASGPYLSELTCAPTAGHLCSTHRDVQHVEPLRAVQAQDRCGLKAAQDLPASWSQLAQVLGSLGTSFFHPAACRYTPKSCLKPQALGSCTCRGLAILGFDRCRRLRQELEASGLASFASAELLEGKAAGV